MKINGINVEVIELNTVVVGSGAAAWGAADRLAALGQRDIAVVTEGINCGTSRNAGSDKQTYYKLTTAGGGADSIAEMADTLFGGGATDGDIALCEAALSARSFYKLVEIGVPFPQNSSGEFVGYKTDHDPRQRATSAGPLTSKNMTERLQEQVLAKGVPVYDDHMVIRVLTDGGRCVGVLCLNKSRLDDADGRYVVFAAKNVVYATGGPAGLYADSVFPVGHNGASGFAFEAGVVGKNLTEWQYGIASVKFRWNLSGTYQQVLPRYVSTDADGENPVEFLREHFDSDRSMLNAVFLKGYQWPFDPRKIDGYGSSLVDLLVYVETKVKGRRVWLDFLHNPSELAADFSNVGGECRNYLEQSRALFGTPIERLAHMNRPAIDLYMSNGIDITKEMLEIAVSAQHNNGGLDVNHWWESNVKHFFPVGEVAGTHGVYRPGGSALNSGQCGGLRAAQFITARYGGAAADVSCAEEQIADRIARVEGLIAAEGVSSIADKRRVLGERMSKDAAFIRNADGLKSVLNAARRDLESFWQEARIGSISELADALSCYDLLVAQCVYAAAMLDYVEVGGQSRGSYLISDRPLGGDVRLDDALSGRVQEALLGRPCVWRDVRPVPEQDYWFENVWNDNINDNIIK